MNKKVTCHPPMEGARVFVKTTKLLLVELSRTLDGFVSFALKRLKI